DALAADHAEERQPVVGRGDEVRALPEQGARGIEEAERCVRAGIDVGEHRAESEGGRPYPSDVSGRASGEEETDVREGAADRREQARIAERGEIRVGRVVELGGQGRG